jgi:fatty acid desaturase
MRDEVLDALDRATLVDAAGLAYLAFKPTLVPRWGRVWLDIASGWMAIALCGFALVWFSGRSLAGDAALAAAGALAFGFLIAYLHLFLHEGAHFNLHPDRARNDALCNLAVSGFIGLDVRQYRPIHWDHHRFLASEQDTEITYVDPLDLLFLLKGLTGWRALQALTTRRRAARAEPVAPASGRGVVVLGALANASALAAMAWSRHWVLALAWIGGMLVFFPFFGGLRQLLEHRDRRDDAPPVRRAAHRLFGHGAFARWFGGAGFNRHLLHHWEPQISYTRLGDLERYLRGTQAAGLLASHSTSYARAFRDLFRASA